MSEYQVEAELIFDADEQALQQAVDDAEQQIGSVSVDPAGMDTAGMSTTSATGTVEAAVGGALAESLVDLADERNKLLQQMIETSEQAAFDNAQGGAGGGGLGKGTLLSRIAPSLGIGTGLAGSGATAGVFGAPLAIGGIGMYTVGKKRGKEGEFRFRDLFYGAEEDEKGGIKPNESPLEFIKRRVGSITDQFEEAFAELGSIDWGKQFEEGLNLKNGTLQVSVPENFSTKLQLPDPSNLPKLEPPGSIPNLGIPKGIPSLGVPSPEEIPELNLPSGENFPPELQVPKWLKNSSLMKGKKQVDDKYEGPKGFGKTPFGTDGAPSAAAAAGPGGRNRNKEQDNSNSEDSQTEITVSPTVTVEGTTQREVERKVDQAVEDAKEELRKELQRAFRKR